MKRFLSLIALIVVACAACQSASAQAVDVSVCDVLSNTQSFDGKTVRVKGLVVAGFDDFVIKDASCNQAVNAIWLAYPQGSKGKAGAAAFIQLQLAKNNPAPTENTARPSVKLDRNKDFKQFDSLLSTPYKAGGMCLGCVRYTVSATLVGRLDGSKDAGVKRDGAGKVVAVRGYGNMNLYRARLVLESVSDVSQHEIDYSKAGTATRDDSTDETSASDPVAAAHQAARAFDPNSDAYKQVELSAAAYGKEGEDNGVNIGFGAANEIPRNDTAKGDGDSPDGILINCTFDMDRLKGEALSRAISHIGTHIVDIRDPGTSTATPYSLEYRAWQTTVLSAIAARQKTLTAPGGFLLWDSSWPGTDRSKKVDEGIKSVLINWAALKATD